MNFFEEIEILSYVFILINLLLLNGNHVKYDLYYILNKKIALNLLLKNNEFK